MKNILFLLPLIAAFRLSAQTQPIPLRGDFALKNVHTGKYVRIKDANSADGTPIVAYSPENWKCMTWQFQRSPTGSYILKNLFSGKTLQPPKGETKPGTALEEQPLDTQKSPEYELVATGKEQYRVRLKGTNLFLTPSDPHGATNSLILLQPEQPGDLQEWVLIEQHPTM
jgi:Ricin-type beta-trefoil lectin domain-like